MAIWGLGEQGGPTHQSPHLKACSLVLFAFIIWISTLEQITSRQKILSPASLAKQNSLIAYNKLPHPEYIY